MITTFKPTSKLLEPYVDCFYVFRQRRKKSISYIAFPHVNTGLSFFKNSVIARRQNEVSIHAIPSNKPSVHIEVLGRYVRPVFVHYSGYIQEIAVVFKPLGINHFINDSLHTIAPGYSQAFNNASWIKTGKAIFNETTVPARIDVLEQFLIRQLHERDLSHMYQALNYLSATENDYSVEEIASLLNMNLKTFQRHFLKNLCCTPSDYKRIAKFRHSLNLGWMEKEIKKLTAVAYASNYYDQSYFVREYKKLTSLNPKAFFKTVTLLADTNIVWKLK